MKTLVASGLRLTASVLSGLPSMAAVAAEGGVPLTELANSTHFHGIAVDPHRGDHFYLATHHGVFTVDASGHAIRALSDTNDYMGFTPHPTEART